MPDYSKGKLYTIRCKTDASLIYVGTTIQSLSQRLAAHRRDSKRFPNVKLYSTIADNWDDWYIELYENYPCDNKEQLLKREGEIVRQIGNLNKFISGRTKEEYRIEHKEAKKEYDKIFKKENAEKIEERAKIYRKENAEKIKERTKIYNDKTKEKRRQIYQEKKRKAQEKDLVI